MRLSEEAYRRRLTTTAAEPEWDLLCRVSVPPSSSCPPPRCTRDSYQPYLHLDHISPHGPPALVLLPVLQQKANYPQLVVGFAVDCTATAMFQALERGGQRYPRRNSFGSSSSFSPPGD